MLNYFHAHLRELVCHHVANPPGLVLGGLPQSGHDQRLEVLLGQQRGDADTRLHSQETHRVLQDAFMRKTSTYLAHYLDCFCFQEFQPSQPILIKWERHTSEDTFKDTRIITNSPVRQKPVQ